MAIAWVPLNRFNPEPLSRILMSSASGQRHSQREDSVREILVPTLTYHFLLSEARLRLVTQIPCSLAFMTFDCRYSSVTHTLV